MENGYLYHYGVKGQKWGVRRYQNKDGTLTNAGKSRYGDSTVSEESRQINGVVRGLPMTSEEADSGKCNPNKPDRWCDREEYNTQMAEKGGYLYNCQSCAVAFEARVRGYDVIAGSRSNNPTADMIQSDISKAFIDPTTGKPPVAKKFDCNISEAKVKRWDELQWAEDFHNDPKKQKELDDMVNEDSNNRKNIDKMLTENIKRGERYVIETKTFDAEASDYRNHYTLVDWTNSTDPLAIEPQSKYAYPDKIPSYSDKQRRPYIDCAGVDYNELLLGVELTRVDNCDLNYDVVEKVTERSKR